MGVKNTDYIQSLLAMLSDAEQEQLYEQLERFQQLTDMLPRSERVNPSRPYKFEEPKLYSTEDIEKRMLQLIFSLEKDKQWDRILPILAWDLGALNPPNVVLNVINRWAFESYPEKVLTEDWGEHWKRAVHHSDKMLFKSLLKRRHELSRDVYVSFFLYASPSRSAWGEAFAYLVSIEKDELEKYRIVFLGDQILAHSTYPHSDNLDKVNGLKKDILGTIGVKKDVGDIPDSLLSEVLQELLSWDNK